MIKEIDNNHLEHFPSVEFCDICGADHLFSERDIAKRYSFAVGEDANAEIPINFDNKPELPTSTNRNEQDNLYPIKEMDEIKFNRVFISSRERETVIIAVVQIYFELDIDQFPPEIVNKIKTKERILVALEKSLEQEVDIVCLPELSICEEWISEFAAKYPKLSIIAGSYYDSENHNVCKILIDANIEKYSQIKINPSEFESPQETGQGMVSGNIVNIFETKFGNVSVLICRDFGNIIRDLKDKIDIVFVPSYNPKPDRFAETANSHVTDYPSYIILSNTSLFGGSSIFGQIDKIHFKKLENNGCREKGKMDYKLCELRSGEE